MNPKVSSLLKKEKQRGASCPASFVLSSETGTNAPNRQLFARVLIGCSRLLSIIIRICVSRGFSVLL